MRVSLSIVSDISSMIRFDLFAASRAIAMAILFALCVPVFECVGVLSVWVFENVLSNSLLV
jgi:uncharacterized membrane protein